MTVTANMSTRAFSVEQVEALHFLSPPAPCFKAMLLDPGFTGKGR